MFRITTTRGVRHCDGWTRREALRIGALGLGGLTLPSLLAAAPAKKPRARSAVVLFLSGGPSQLDMWDLKPEAPEEIRGTFRPVATNVPGIRISEHLPRMARLADRYAIVRSMSHASTNHPAASYWMMVGTPIARRAQQAVTLSREDRPHPGSVLAKLLPRAEMPSFVMVPEAISPVGPVRPGQHAGFLGARFDPYLVASDPNLPDYDPGPLRREDDVSTDRLAGRRRLLDHLAGHALGDVADRAFDLIASPAAQKAFDVSAEPAKVRDRYGRHTFGQSVLLTRRLIEAGVRLVQVNWVRHDNAKGGQGYDSHRDHLAWSKKELLPPTDAACASLLEDLAERGLLDETLVMIVGEFGRTPKFNNNGGRDHWSKCFSVVLAGGGIQGGQVYGSSDRIAAYPTSDPVSPQDLVATLYHLMGVDPHTYITDLQGRPYPLVNGKPVTGLL
jgi:hypothetical protein